mgnify:CR=1 FL=1
MEEKPRIIALYLPQYHPFKENDEWWGKGFTEWTNVGRAKPLFKGHYQPRIPADLGYYDLRLPQVREQQAELAREAGIEGFCYWHYWFGNGKRLMESVFDEVLESGKPDFPFCLGWANHSWYAKNWNTKDTKGKDRLLIEQTFPGDDDIRKHYEYVLRAFKDPRYVKVGNKPFFMIFIADNIPNNFIELWNKWAKEDGFDGIYFVSNVSLKASVEEYKLKGFSSVIKARTSAIIDNQMSRKSVVLWKKIKSHIFNIPDRCALYEDAMKNFVDEEDLDENIIPNLIPGFDHSPRSGKYGLIFHKSTPDLFYEHCCQVLDLVKKKENKIIMLRSWNEWGEGNYMEPDLEFGKGYINALKKALQQY